MPAFPRPPFFPLVRVPQFLGAALRADLLDYALSQLDSLSPAAVGGGAVRSDRRIARSTSEVGLWRSVLKDRFRTHLPSILNGLGMRPFEHRFEFELVAHHDGARFGLHVDTGRMEDGARVPRRLSGVYYFHREPCGFTGGASRFHSLPAGQTRDVAPDQDLLVAFPAFAPHEVLPVSVPSGAAEDARFAVNIWLHDRGEGAAPSPPDTRSDPQRVATGAG